MRMKQILILAALYTAFSFSVEASIAPSVVSTPSSSSSSSSSPGLAKPGDSQAQKDNSTDPTKPKDDVKPQVADDKKGNIDPEKEKAFFDRLRNLPRNSQGWCGRGTREGIELLTGEKYQGANGGDFGPNLLKTGLWREAYPGETYSPDQLVVRSIQYAPYGHAEVLYKGTVSSDFFQTRSIVKHSSSYRDYVYVGRS